MTLFLVNIVLAVIWAAMTGSFAFLNLAFGFVLGIFALSIMRAEIGSVGYFTRARRIISLILFFLYELVLSAWRVAKLVLSPKMDLHPGIFAYKLEVKSDIEITVLANMITLTPGTLTVDISDDKKTLYIHAIDCSDIEATKQDIASGFERKIMEAFN